MSTIDLVDATAYCVLGDAESADAAALRFVDRWPGFGWARLVGCVSAAWTGDQRRAAAQMMGLREAVPDLTLDRVKAMWSWPAQACLGPVYATLGEYGLE